MAIGMGPCSCISLLYGVFVSAVALFVWCLACATVLVLTRSASADTVLHWMSGGVLLLLSMIYCHTAQRTYSLTQWAIGAAELETLREKQLSATVAALAALFGTGFSLWAFGSAPICTLDAQESPPLHKNNATVTALREDPECTSAGGTYAVTGAIILAIYHTWVLHKLTIVDEGRLMHTQSDTWSAELQNAEQQHSRRSAALGAKAEALKVSPQARP